MCKNPDEIIDGCVYKIISLVNPDLVYFGSTKNFYKRMSRHKADYKRYLKNGYSYTTLYDIIDLGKYSTEIVKEFKHITRRELEDFETEFIQNNKCVNKRQSITEQMKIDNRNQSQKKYYENNKNRINQQRNQPHICEICGCNYTTANKSAHSKSYKHQSAVNQKLLDLENKNKELTEEIAAIKPKIVIKMKVKTLNNNAELTINN